MHKARRPTHFRRTSLFATLAITGAIACSRDSSTGVKPVNGVTCQAASGSGRITLGSLQTTTVDCTQGGMLFELAGGGASYLLVPEFATGNVAITSVPYTIGSPNASKSV